MAYTVYVHVHVIECQHKYTQMSYKRGKVLLKTTALEILVNQRIISCYDKIKY